MSGFYLDPVCLFAWLASKWARMVQAQPDHTAGWRFISLQVINRPWATTAVSRRDTRRSRRRAEAAAGRGRWRGPQHPHLSGLVLAQAGLTLEEFEKLL